MQFLRSSILRHVRVQNLGPPRLLAGERESLSRPRCLSISTGNDNLMSRVLVLVKKYDKIDAAKVTETADFQKDLCLDSLDRVELVMALEQEFSIEIPDDKADKLTCCADVVKYILSETDNKVEKIPDQV